MHIRGSHFVLCLTVVGFAAGVNFPPSQRQGKAPARAVLKPARNRHPPQTAILQSVGMRSHGEESSGVVSLSQELDMVEPIVGAPDNTEQQPPATTASAVPENSTLPAVATTTEADMFNSYMNTHRKRYYAKYRADRRRSALLENMEEIKEHNKAFEAGSNRFRMAPNAFADMQNSEYRKRLVRLKMDPHRKVEPAMADEIVSSSNELPDEIDWRKKGFVTEAANQKTCGSCYAFSVAYAISAQLMKHIGRVELVSEQQMVDCSTANGNLGCGGGSLRNTLKYLEQAGGVMRDVDYPYTSSVSRQMDGYCPRVCVGARRESGSPLYLKSEDIPTR
uniref:Cathepsin propeptide inhibitor domain-containing protein n=1 Tax=Anopheles epiroticus TaxID=199890 RepID=A0A182PQU1_9DIPT